MKTIEYSKNDEYEQNNLRENDREDTHYLFVDGLMVKNELIDLWDDEGAYVRVKPTNTFAPAVVNIYDVDVAWIQSHIYPNGALKFTKKNDPEWWTLCELVAGFRNEKQEYYFIFKFYSGYRQKGALSSSAGIIGSFRTINVLTVIILFMLAAKRKVYLETWLVVTSLVVFQITTYIRYIYKEKHSIAA